LRKRERQRHRDKREIQREKDKREIDILTQVILWLLLSQT
jgi:hypothetical protein